MAELNSKQIDSRRISKNAIKIKEAYSQCRSGSHTPPLTKIHKLNLKELNMYKESLTRSLNRKKKIKNSEPKSEYQKTIVNVDKKQKEVSNSNNKRKRECKQASPYSYGDTLPDSEDEEIIIEQRRKQRRQLLEQLNDCCDTRDSSNILKDFEGTSSKCKKIENPTENCLTNMKELTDMFAEKDDFTTSDTVTQDNSKHSAQLVDNWDDADGYYRITIGDIINENKYTIKAMLGQGVFANVVRAKDNSKDNTEVAIKIIRNNDLMYKTGLKELIILKKIGLADPENKHHCVKLLGNFMHKGHLCLVLESLYMDLRHVIKKYGKQYSISMRTLSSYSRQLLVALRLLKKSGIIHADIKPDNILINENKNVLKLCDFGSAFTEDNYELTPYLVSRFYRAPEIILGISYNHGVDLWSSACTIYEMATGKIMFTGSSNNKMLKCFMDLKGKIPTRLLRKSKFKNQHFNFRNNFLLHKKDELSGRENYEEISYIIPVRDLSKDLQKHNKKSKIAESNKLTHLKDLLDKMVNLDPNQRISVHDCLKHPFICGD